MNPEEQSCREGSMTLAVAVEEMAHQLDVETVEEMSPAMAHPEGPPLVDRKAVWHITMELIHSLEERPL